MSNPVLQRLCIQSSANPLTKNYWVSAVSEFHNLRTLTVVAMFVALATVISSFFVPVGENLKIFFTFLPEAIYCTIGGPFVGMAAGMVADLVGYVMHPDGGFFFGYTISKMAGALIYGLCFYQSKVTLPRIIIAKTSVNLSVNIGLGCLWSQMMFQKGYLYYLGKSVVKNMAMLPVEILLLFLMFAALRKVALRWK